MGEEEIIIFFILFLIGILLFHAFEKIVLFYAIQHKSKWIEGFKNKSPL